MLHRVGSVGRSAWSLITGLIYRYINAVIILFIIAGVLALLFSCTVGVTVQSISIWGSSTVQASGGDSRCISTIIV